MESFKIVTRSRRKGFPVSLDHLGLDSAKRAHRFHSSFPMYRETPLVSLDGLAARLGVAKVFVKDESYRFGLNAFKVLGGSYAIGQWIAGKLGVSIDELTFDRIVSPEVKKTLGDLTFISATDGNHGRGVAWTANRLGQKSVIYMPKGSAAERLANIRAEGADASITELNYDDAVRLANKHAEERGWVMVQDTAWEGYEDIPNWIMQGYTTLAYETWKQLDGTKPSHLFLQAGVGSFAASVQGFFAAALGDERPITTIVEPNAADCVFRTAEAADGKIHPVTGDMNTIMAGLACGEPATVAWKVLDAYADHFVSAPDYAAAQGMRILGNPVGTDARVVSGESGAAAFGVATEIMRDPNLNDMKKKLGIDEKSVLLFVSTEGDTDRENYRRIVWDGLYPKKEAPRC